MAREQVARQKDQDQIGLVAPAALVDDPDAIGIAVVRDADVGAHLDDLDFQILDVALVLRVGQVVRKAPVRLAVQLDDVAADAAQELRAVESGDAVAGVDHDLEAASGPDHPGDRVEVVLAGAPLAQPAGPAFVVAALDRRPQTLDLVLGQRRRTRVHHLHAVVLDGIVAAGDVGAAVELPVGGREVEDRRGDRADVDDVDAPGARALDEAQLESVRRQAIVLADRDPPAAVTSDHGRVGAPDLTKDVGVDVAADEPAHVIGAEHVRVQHCAVLSATLL